MEQEQKPQDTGASETKPQGADELKNLKAEMNRKLDNVAEQLRAFVEQSKPKPQPEAETPRTKKPSVFEDEDAFAAHILTEAEKKAEAKLAAAQAAQARQQQTISALVADFPELQHGNHELTKKAVETYNSLSAEERNMSSAYKLAVQQAALELGIKPVSKRTDDDVYMLPGEGSPAPRKRKSADEDIDWRTEEFGRLMGLNMDDPKVRERIKRKHGRKGYDTWG